MTHHQHIGPAAQYVIHRVGNEVEERPELPPPPFAQITLQELAWGLDRLEDTDPDVMRAILRGLVYERDAAAARIVRSLRSRR